MSTNEDVRFVRDVWEWKNRRGFFHDNHSHPSNTSSASMANEEGSFVFASDLFFLNPYETTKMALKFQSFDSKRFLEGNGYSLQQYVCKVKLVNPNNKQVSSKAHSFKKSD